MKTLKWTLALLCTLSLWACDDDDSAGTGGEIVGGAGGEIVGGAGGEIVGGAGGALVGGAGGEIVGGAGGAIVGGAGGAIVGGAGGEIVGGAGGEIVGGAGGEIVGGAGGEEGGEPLDLTRWIAFTSVCRHLELDDRLLDLLTSVESSSGALKALIGVQLDCVDDAVTCDDFFTCQGIDRESRCSVWAPATCDDTVLVGCSEGYTQRIDCATEGLGNPQCGDVDGSATCHSGACTERHCEDDVLVRCEGGIATRTDCADQGLTCQGEGEDANCQSPLCQASHCEDDALVICDGGEEQARLNCAGPLLQLSCLGDGEPTCGQADAPTCTPSCAGTVATFCAFDSPSTLDCALMPGATCKADNAGVYCILP